ncbi:MAG: leucine-rich repeat protein [Bacteroidales bacterium]|nr:leucine-rich repeat protein [Bacteroidales bacterium]
MNKKLKSVIACILVLTVLFSIGTISAFATSSNGFEYEIVDDEVTITGYTGSTSTLNIPSSVNGYPVTAIKENAFKDCTTVDSISLPTTLKSIGANAFLKTAFYKDKNNWDNNVLYVGDALIDTDYKLVGACDIKEGTRIIADSAFMLSNSVTSVSIPSSVQYIGDSALINCDKLSEINVSKDNDFFSSLNGVLLNKEQTHLIAYPNDADRTVYSVPDSVVVIENRAFKYSLNISTISMPQSVSCIGEEAFAYCKSLTNIHLPDNLTELSNGVFDHCNSLKYLILPSKAEAVGDNAFKWCSSLNSLTLPSKVKTIGTNAFYNCRALEEITIPKSVSLIDEAAFYNCKSLKSINYCGDSDLWNKIKIKEHNTILSDVNINYNVNINGSTGNIAEDLPVVTEPVTTPTTEPTTPDVNEGPDTKWMSIEMYSKNSYSSSGDNYYISDAVYSFYNAPVEETKCASVTTSDGNTEALVMALDSTLPYDFNIGSIYYIKQTESPYGYIADSTWYKLEVTEKGYVLTDCATDKRVGYSNNNNRIKMLATPIVGSVALLSSAEDSAPNGYSEIGTYCVKECETDNTLYFDIYNRFNGYETKYGSKNYTLYTNEHIALYDLPVGKYYFEKIVEELDETTLSERHYFEIKPNDSGIDCDLVKVEIKICNDPQNTFLMGDVNSDSKFNIKDATAVQKYLAHMVELDDVQKENADYNNDGKINVKDATTIQKVLAGFNV